MTNKQFTRRQPHYSEDDYFFNQNKHYSNTLRHNNWNNERPDPIYQPDIFDTYTHAEQTRQSYQLLPKIQAITSYSKNLQLQKPYNYTGLPTKSKAK